MKANIFNLQAYFEARVIKRNSRGEPLVLLDLTSKCKDKVEFCGGLSDIDPYEPTSTETASVMQYGIYGDDV